jgi:hypothetical protein
MLKVRSNLESLIKSLITVEGSVPCDERQVSSVGMEDKGQERAIPVSDLPAIDRTLFCMLSNWSKVLFSRRVPSR